MKLLVAFLLAWGIYLLQKAVYDHLWDKGLASDLSFEKDVLYEGEENTLIEVIENRKYLPLPILQVKFAITRTFLFQKQENTSVTDKYYRSDYFTVMPWQKITRSYPFICSKRGCFFTENIDLICRPFFLEQWMVVSQPQYAGVCVLPARIDHREVSENVKKLLGETEKNLRINEDPFTFSGIRDYQPYDNMRSINWKISARHDKLLVNTYNSTFSKKVVLLLNLETNSMVHAEQTREWAIRIASHLAGHFISARIPTALYTNGRDVAAAEEGPGCPAIEAGADMAHIRVIEVALARLNEKETGMPFLSLMEERIRTGKDPVEYIIISNYRKKDITGRYEALLSEGHGVHFIIPAVLHEKEEELDLTKYILWMRKD
ncbi:MAG: DUF58 domain-containing protein [Lachnospiraceae bacterium]|nr:DUF58 domain-containing protein [Lachnospiraceae bacterium]